MEKWEASKKLKKPDGTIAIVWEGKLHNWDGPALIPQGKEKKGGKALRGANAYRKKYFLSNATFYRNPWIKKNEESFCGSQARIWSFLYSCSKCNKA